MSWEQEVKEIERRRYLAQQQGGKEGIAKQHARGRMTVSYTHLTLPTKNEV